MPNIKSAKKRVKIIATKTKQNQTLKTAIKTIIKKFDEVLIKGDKAEAEIALREAVKKIDMGAAKGILNKNLASRKKSQLAIKLNYKPWSFLRLPLTCSHRK